MQEAQTTTPTGEQGAAPKATLLDDLKSFAREHRELAKKNYASFKERYGSPADRVREIRARVQRGVDRVKEDAVKGYRKLEHDIEARTKGTNGNGASNGNGHGAHESQ